MPLQHLLIWNSSLQVSSSPLCRQFLQYSLSLLLRFFSTAEINLGFFIFNHYLLTLSFHQLIFVQMYRVYARERERDYIFVYILYI